MGTNGSGHPAGEPAKVLFEKANKFLASLFPPQRDLTPGNEYTLFHFVDPNREVFDYLVPSSRFRRGLPLAAMNPDQLQAATELLEASLIKRGFQKVEQIRMLEYVLAAREKDDSKRFVRNPQGYYFTIFGTPSEQGQLQSDKAWSWRYEGHHISLHWTVLGDQIISSTPQFLGAQPVEVTEEVQHGPSKGTRVLGREEDLARKLIHDFSETQRQVARAQVGWDIETSNVRHPLYERRPPLLEDRGVPYDALTDGQRRTLRDLVEEYASLQVSSIAEERLVKIDNTGWNSVKFFMMGGLMAGDALYYRVRGSTFVIEYINKAFSRPQDAPDHQHSVWRDFQGDWGRQMLHDHQGYGPDVLRQHYETSPHHAVDRRHHHANSAPHVRRAHAPVRRWDLGKLGERTIWMPLPTSRRHHS
jgi:hypothetical protein